MLEALRLGKVLTGQIGTSAAGCIVVALVYLGRYQLRPRGLLMLL